MTEDENDIRKVCKCQNIYDLEPVDRIYLLEQQYKKQRLWRSFSVSGRDYKSKYDTGDERE